MNNHIIIDRKVRFIFFILLLFLIFTISLYESENTIEVVGNAIRWLAK